MILLEIGLALVVIILLGLFVVIYNTLVMLKNNINKAWANIDVLLQQRHDEIGKLVDTVKGYKNYEQSVLTQVTALRTQWASIPPNDVQGKMAASNGISAALKTMFATVENYPDLKADASFLDLQHQITVLETEIADRREFYNDTVNQFNIKIAVIPYNFFAGMFHYTTQPLFQVPGEDRQDVKIDVS